MRMLSMLVLAAVTACTGDSVSPGSLDGTRRVVVDTVADTITVLTRSGSSWGSAELVEELRIGRADGADHEMFGRIDAITALPGGGVLVYDGQVNVVRHYASDGRYIGQFGRVGSGPGEYRIVVGMTPLADGRLAVYDFGNRRVNVHASSGTLDATWLVRADVGERRPLHPHPGGGVFLHDELASGAEVIVRLDANGRVGDTIVIPNSDHRRAGISRQIGTRNVGAPMPFAADHHWTVGGGGELITAVGDRYAIDVRRGDGFVRRISRAAATVAVSAEERTAEEARVTARLRRFVPDWTWEGPPIPSTKPPIRWLHAGADGTLWVLIAQPGSVVPEGERTGSSLTFVREPFVFDLFLMDGTFLGQVRAPDSLLLLPFPVVSQNVVWGVVRGQDDVQQVVRFRVHAPPTLR